MKIDPRNIEVIDDESVEILKKMTGAQRMIAAAKMFDTAKALTRANIKMNHPDWNEEQIKKEVLRRLGNEPG